MKASLISFLIAITAFFFVVSDIDDNDAVPIKNKVWEGYQTNIGAHYYAYSPYSTEYSIATSFIKLPTSLNVNGGKRKAYISLGVAGLYGPIELGIVNSGYGWCPFYYDANLKKYQDYTNSYAPYGTEIVGIQIEVTSRRIIIFSLTFRKSSLRVIQSFQITINVSHLLEYENDKVKFRFFRFAKLTPIGIDNQNDGTFMKGGQFTGLTIVKNGYGIDWGIGLDDIDVAWKVSSKKIQISYDDRTDIFDIKHETIIDKLTEEEIEMFKQLPELRFSSVSIKLNPDEYSIKLKMKVPFEDCFEFFSPNKNEIDIHIYSTSGDLINLKYDESCFSFDKDEILFIYIKTITGRNIDIPMKFKKYKNFLPYQPIDKKFDFNEYKNNELTEPFEITYTKREGEALYILANNPEKLYAQNMNKPLIRNYITDKEVFFTMDYNCQYGGGYMGYRLKNIGENDLFVTVRNLGYSTDWFGQKEFVDFYNVNFRFKNQDKLSPEDLAILKEKFKEEYTANPRAPITYRIPPGQFFFVLGGTSNDAYNNINVFETSNMKINAGNIANGVVLFDVKGKAEAILFYYTNYQDINENDRSNEFLMNGIYPDGNFIGAQYKGYDDCHGVIDGYAFWKFNEQTESQFLPVKIINYFRDGDSLKDQVPYSEILDTKRHEFIKDHWITNSNVQKSSEDREAVIGSDLTEFITCDSEFQPIKIDNFHYDGRGWVANTANWMINYITSYYLINSGNREREVIITISGHGVVACFAVDSNGYIIGESEQYSLFDNEHGKEIVHEFSYTAKIEPNSQVKFYIEHTLLANSNGIVIHKAYLK